LQVTPKFCKQFAQVGIVINEALAQYKQEVEAGTFPGPQFSPYKMPQTELDRFSTLLGDEGLGDAAASAKLAADDTVEQ
jgi:3-methyl-2-oxobutanoate hydroxymethyltransferase